jgi:competence protein ComGC
MAKLSILIEVWEFIKHNKKYWLIPIITILLLVGILLVVTGGSAIAPFIYTIF